MTPKETTLAILREAETRADRSLQGLVSYTATAESYLAEAQENMARYQQRLDDNHAHIAEAEQRLREIQDAIRAMEGKP